LPKEICLIFLSIIFLSACGSAPRFTSRGKTEIREKNFSHTEKNSSSEVLETQKGIASFYSDQFNGKITYSGEVYNMFGLSAAHPSYQMGTIVRVTNLSNDKSVVIPINDRMPFRPDRIIDLSLGTAQELEIISVGITEVKVEVLEWGKGKK
jgi:rare lipoprotein A